MNVVFISPHFPLYFHNFCSRLKIRGVNVLGIGDASYQEISKETKDSLSEYYRVDSLENYDEVIHIPMSSGLSGSCQTAIMLSQDYNGKVHVVNNQRISVTQRQSVLDALALIDAGKSGAEIKEILEADKFNSTIYIMIDTLYYLKKGGRITPAAAALGTLLKLKPVLQIQGEKLDAFAKARTVNQAKTIMMNAIKSDIEKRFGGVSKDNQIYLQIAHTQNEEAAKALAQELHEVFPDYPIYIDHLSLSVSCHIGPGSLAIACCKKMSI